MSYTLTDEELAIQQEMDTYIRTNNKTLGQNKQQEILALTTMAQFYIHNP